MVIDKYMTAAGVESFCEATKSWVDIVKLGWGTSACMPRDIVQKKCTLFREAGMEVCPGGTLFELAYLQHKLPETLEEARNLGFTMIEVSNGSVPIEESEKLRIIDKVAAKGFRVISEVGCKFVEEDRRLSLETRVSHIKRELNAGAWKVILEARESGTLGIYNSSGKTQHHLLDGLVSEISLDDLIFEAPLRSQQCDLILKLGPNVNLGNIAPIDLFSLETLRQGLRSDTLRQFHMDLPMIRFELGPNGARAGSLRGDVLIVVDALRASTTIVAALAAGIRAVRPVSSPEECRGELTAGERGGHKIPYLDYDNSPLAFRSADVAGKELVLTTTNGTECLLCAASAPDSVVLVGALVNASAVGRSALQLARKRKSNITIVIAGRNNEIAPEDQIAATEIAFVMPGAPFGGEIGLLTSSDPVLDFLNSASGRNLCALGRRDDVLFCAAKDTFDIVPVYKSGKISALSVDAAEIATPLEMQ